MPQNPLVQGSCEGEGNFSFLARDALSRTLLMREGCLIMCEDASPAAQPVLTWRKNAHRFQKSAHRFRKSAHRFRKSAHRFSVSEHQSQVSKTFSAFSFAIPQNSCTFAPEFLWGLLRTEKSVRRDAKLVNGNLENFKDTREHSENTVCLLQAWSMSLYLCLR